MLGGLSVVWCAGPVTHVQEEDFSGPRRNRRQGRSFLLRVIRSVTLETSSRTAAGLYSRAADKRAAAAKPKYLGSSGSARDLPVTKVERFASWTHFCCGCGVEMYLSRVARTLPTATGGVLFAQPISPPASARPPSERIVERRRGGKSDKNTSLTFLVRERPAESNNGTNRRKLRSRSS